MVDPGWKWPGQLEELFVLVPAIRGCFLLPPLSRAVYLPVVAFYVVHCWFRPGTVYCKNNGTSVMFQLVA